SRRRHTRSDRDWSSDVCSSDLDSCPKASLGPLPQIHSTRLGRGWHGTPSGQACTASSGTNQTKRSQSHHVQQSHPHRPTRTERRSEERRVGKECRTVGKRCESK